MPGFTHAISEHISAGYPALLTVTEEPSEALKAVTLACKAQAPRLRVWDFDAGLDGNTDLREPTDALHAIQSAWAQEHANEPDPPRWVVVMRHAHRFLGDPMVSAALINFVAFGKEHGVHVLILAPSADLPAELDRVFAVLRHDLPSASDLEHIARSVDPDISPEALAPIARAASGLTITEAENAFALSTVRNAGTIRAETVWEQKTAALQKTGYLSLCRSGQTFADIGGMEGLKRFGHRALRADKPTNVQPRGMMLLGIPGTGKSAFAKALGTETGRPTLTLDFGALFGSLVGQTEANIRRALAIADAMAPCVLFVDEIEKALSGSSGGASDGGTSQRSFGTLLTWLNDHTSDVFFICTANDVSALPPEFSRAERFDAVFFLDTPTSAERADIWTQYRESYDVPKAEPRPADEGWTGAEIKSACRLASLLGAPLSETARQVVPVSVTAAERIANLRRWSHSRALDARTGATYADPTQAAPIMRAEESSRARRIGA